MTRQEALSIFTVAGFDVEQVWELVNQYWPRNEHYYKVLNDNPWWLIKTKFGCIQIGWRKHVIQIDWTDTPYRGRVQEDKASGTTDVTWGDTYTHAWGELKAVEYLHSLAQKLYAVRKETVSL